MKFIEVCAGAGGLSSGLIDSGFTPILLNDINKDCCATLALNHPNVKIKCCSMTDLNLKKYVNRIDLLASGVPCQSFAISGQRRGLEDPRGNLLLCFIKMIHYVKPKMFLIENVKGLTNHDGGKTFKYIIKLIKKKGLYKVSYQILNAVNYKVPQKRERVFIVGLLKTYSDIEFQFPSPRKQLIVLKDVLKDVPDSPGAKYPPIKVKLFKMIPQGGCWINLPVKLQKEYMGKSYYSGGGKRGILYRLDMNKPSLTLLCSPAQKQTERCHPIKNRPLTTREYARIQTFKDDYQFVGSMSSIYKQIGNSVPRKLAKFMGRSIMKCLVAMKKIDKR
jgi:DNA (cytosine-5)-methyltransferase 1